MRVFLLFRKEHYAPAEIVGVYDNIWTPTVIKNKHEEQKGEPPFFYIQEFEVAK